MPGMRYLYPGSYRTTYSDLPYRWLCFVRGWILTTGGGQVLTYNRPESALVRGSSSIHRSPPRVSQATSRSMNRIHCHSSFICMVTFRARGPRFLEPKEPTTPHQHHLLAKGRSWEHETHQLHQPGSNFELGLVKTLAVTPDSNSSDVLRLGINDTVLSELGQQRAFFIVSSLRQMMSNVYGVIEVHRSCKTVLSLWPERAAERRMAECSEDR